ncbi:MAG: formylglycine-generating enzyme family protein [bacterium]|nr:formylglycine-generating enzyme family protein [bacterium]
MNKKKLLLPGLLALFALTVSASSIYPSIKKVLTHEPEIWTPQLGRPPRTGDMYTNPKDKSLMIWISGDTFSMGSKNGLPDEKPVHSVKIKGFWLGKYEVTNEQYKRFITDTGRSDPVFFDDETLNKPRQPVVGIKWKRARDYAEWAGLRLPTEPEWEYAARGDDDHEYPTADGSSSHTLANFWGKSGPDTWLEETAPVGSFPPNPYGIHDLAGNAWEWTNSRYMPYPYTTQNGREDLNIKGFRVMRGGSWFFSDKYMKTTHRHKFRWQLRMDYVGMRVAATKVPGQK